jgi:hypothetical protein
MVLLRLAQPHTILRKPSALRNCRRGRQRCSLVLFQSVMVMCSSGVAGRAGWPWDLQTRSCQCQPATWALCVAVSFHIRKLHWWWVSANGVLRSV